MGEKDLSSYTRFEEPKDSSKPKKRMERQIRISEEQLMYLTNESLIDLIMKYGY